MKFKKTILANGLRLITVPMQENKTVTAMVLVEAGSRYETRENNGISHFLEHMCFKGTKKRKNSLAIATEFEGLGAQYNAFTSNTYTGFYGKVASHKAPQIIEMVSDLYLNAVLPESEIEKEKKVVIEEINMKKDKPQQIVWDVLDEVVYGEHPLGRTIIGTKESVQSFTHEELHGYRAEHYIPEKTVVAIAGGFDEREVEKQIQETFGKFQSKKGSGYEYVVDNQLSPSVKIYDKQTDQTHFVLGFRTFGVSDSRTYALTLLKIILGSGMSSRLFHRLREELGLCYYIFAHSGHDEDCGLFTIAAGVSNSKLPESVIEIKKVILDFIADGPTEAELQKALDFKIGNMYLELETSNDVADWYAFPEIAHEKPQTPEEYEANLRAVTISEIREVAKSVFNLNKINLAVVGPHRGKEASLLAIL